MADTLRDMVVSLSLNSDNFQRNLKTISQQMKEADSEFRLAASGVTGFENTLAGTEAKLTQLQQKFSLQQQAVGQYERALEAARTKLESSVQTHDKLAAKLDAAKQKHADLGQQVDRLTEELREMSEEGLQDTSTYAEMSAELEKLKAGYAESGSEIEKLERQLERSETAMQRNADGVTRAQTNLNNANAELGETRREIDETTQRLNTMASAWTQAGEKMQAFGGKLTKVGDGIADVGKKASVASAAVVALGTKSIKTFASYDDSIRTVYATMGLSAQNGAEDMERLDAAAREMGATTRYTASEAASALNYLALAGYDADKAIETLPVVLNLAQAGGIDLASASDMVTDSMSALGIATSEITGFTDQMAVTAQKSNTSVQQLGEGILKVSGTAKNLAGGTVELNTALGILADNGIKGAEGGTHLRNMILALQNPTGDAEKLLKKMGVAIYDAEGNMRSFKDIFGDLNTAMNGWTQQAKDNAISSIFNKTDLNAANAMLANCGARWDELSGYIRKSDGAAQAMGETMEGGIGGAFRSLSSAIEGLAISFGDTLAPIIQRISERITEVTRRFTALDEGTKMMIVKVGAIVAVAGPVLLIVGKITSATGKLITGIGKFASAIGKVSGKVVSAHGSLGGFLKTLASGPALYVALAAAAAAAVAVIVDYASGAHAAREAQEKLNEAVKEWNENVTTAFENAEGLGTFGLSADDFKVTDNGGADWLSRTIATWTDGKLETNQIVKDTVGAFTGGTEEIRAALKALRDETGGSMVGDLDGDIERLDKIDTEVESILKKRQNGFLTDADTERLQKLIDEREGLKIKYSLVGDIDGAFRQITDGVDAALSRGADKGQVYAEAFSAATQGLGAFTDSLNSEYDARYKAIQAMEDGNAKDAAMSELALWYDQQRTLAVEQYNAAVSEAAEKTGVFTDGGKYAETVSQLETIDDLMKSAAGKDGKSEEAIKLREALAGLDETSIVEMDAALTAMEMAAEQAGVQVPADVQAARDALEAIKTTASDPNNIFPEDISTSISDMFGQLGEEVHEVYATLNCDELSTAYDAWATGDHVPIIPALDKDNLDTDFSSITISGLTGEVTAVSANSVPMDIEDLSLNPETGEVIAMTTDGKAITIGNLNMNPETGEVTAMTADGTPITITDLNMNPETGEITGMTTDGKPITISNLTTNPETGEITGMTANGIPLTIGNLNLNPETGHIDGMTADGTPMEIANLVLDPATGRVIGMVAAAPHFKIIGLSLDPETGEVTAMTAGGEPIKIGNLALDPETGHVTAMTADGEKMDILGLNLNPETGHVTAMTADGKTLDIENLTINPQTGVVTALTSEGQTVTMNISELKNLTGYIGELIIPESTKVPEVSVKVNFDKGTYTDAADPEKEFIAAQQKEHKNLLGLTDFTGSKTYDALHQLAVATKEYNAAVEAGDTDAANGWVDSISYLGQILGNEAGYDGGAGFQAMAQLVANGMQLLSDGELSPEDAQQLMQVMTDMQTILGTPIAADSAWSTYTQQSFQEGLAEAFKVDEGWGNTTAENVQAQLQAGMESLSANLEGLGSDVSAGIGKGAESYDFSGNAGAVQSNFSDDADAAFGRGSPCSTMYPLGSDVAAGIGAGAAEYGFSDDTAKVAQNLKSAAGTNFGTSLLKGAGLNAMSGLAAGIRSGTSYVTIAIRTAAQKAVREAKDALVIKSPSHVFRDEVGAMAMRGFGEGVTEEALRQAKVIRNAARYLTGAAREGVIGVGGSDNRRTYNQQSTVNLSGNSFYIREKQDITELAREIAVLTKRRQAGRGMI